MKPKRKITLFLIVAAIVCYGILSNEKKSSNSDTSFKFHKSHPIQLNHSSTSSIHQIQSPGKSADCNCEEILKKNLKGYREQTYWGSEHPIDKRVNQMDNEEFKDFIEDEIQSKDVDVYWGAEY